MLELSQKWLSVRIVNSDIRHTVSSLRARLDLSQVEVAERAGSPVTRRKVAMLEDGSQDLELHELKQIAQALEVDLGVLLLAIEVSRERAVIGGAA